MLNLLWNEVNQCLNKKFKIKQVINLYECDFDPYVIDNFLEPLHNYVFKPDEKIIIIHTDTQYYLPYTDYSVTLYNVHVALIHYNIPLESVIIMTNHFGLKKELKLLANMFNFTNPINVFESFYDKVGSLSSTDKINLNLKINVNYISHLFCCINGTQRTNRLLLLSMLKHYNLWDSGIITTNFEEKINYSSNLTHIKKSNLDYVILNNPSRIYDKGILTTKHIDILNRFINDFLNKNISHEFVFGKSNDLNTRWQPLFLQKSLIYLITETVGDYPYPFLTEKTFKGILSKRPFIIAGSKNSIALLKDLGFKTFNEFWDESYDSCDYYYQRVDKIIDILKNLVTLPVTELQTICNSMENILEYNFNYYINNFSDIDLKKFLNKINEQK
jgi:hypothetical protein